MRRPQPTLIVIILALAASLPAFAQDDPQPSPSPSPRPTVLQPETPARGDLNGSRFTATSGQALRFTVTFRNQGTADASAHTLTVFVDGVVVSRMNIRPLAKGWLQTYVTPTAWVATTGTHRLEALIDADRQVAESNEGNNASTKTLVVALPTRAAPQAVRTVPSRTSSALQSTRPVSSRHPVALPRRIIRRSIRPPLSR